MHLSQAFFEETVAQATKLRQGLHRIPEASLEEYQTTATLRQVLTEANIPWKACTEVGTLVHFAKHLPGKHLAFRADIDGLPIQEISGLAYRSQREGFMHACGHDGHSAVLLALAFCLKALEKELKHPITLIFQPGEEGLHGAKKLIDAGALEGIDEIYGWHNWPELPLGTAVCPEGPVMAGNGTFRIHFFGRGGHSSQPERNQDALLAASATHLALQQIISRRTAPQEAAVVAVTSIDGKSSETVQRESVKLSGSIRIANENLRASVNESIKSIAEHTAKSYGVLAEVEILPRYQPTVNHSACASLWRESLASVLTVKEGSSPIALPVMASEDFSYYLQATSGAFALIGSAEEDRENHALHHERYNFNDKLIPLVLKAFLRRLDIEITEG